MQIEIIHRPNATDISSWARPIETIHERAAGLTEIVGHRISRGDGFRLAVSCQVVAATDVGEIRIEDGKVRGEHGRRDLAAVGAVADKTGDQAGALGGKC